MYSKYDEAQFHLRLTHELHAKIKQRAKMNNRSINAEIVATLENSIGRTCASDGFMSESERKADAISQEVKNLVFDRLREYKNKK
jgi:hypothetical protein